MGKILLSFILLVSILSGVTAQKQDAGMTRQLLAKNAEATGLSADELNRSIITSAYVDPATGIQMVYLTQSFKGLPVYNQILVLAFKGGLLISKAGSFLANMESLTSGAAAAPAVTPADAVRTSIADAKVTVPAMIMPLTTLENGKKYDFGKLNIAAENIIAELMWVPVDDGKNITAVKLVWQVQLYLSKMPDYWNIRVDATTNTVVNKNNLTVYENFDQFFGKKSNTVKLPAFMKAANTYQQKAFTQTGQGSVDKNPQQVLSPSLVATANYTVIPFPAESPMHTGGTAALRTNPWTLAGGNAVSLGWHNDGVSDYIYSRGNNVYAQEDRDNNNATFGLPATSTTSPDPLNFTYPISYTVQPITPDFQQFAITNLFYWNNLIHDVTYNYGFTEPAGNFQNNNQGRGGAQSDYVIADAQDAGGINNANMATPPDGARPRMQMYLWDPVRSVTTMMVNTPPVIAGSYTAVEGAMSTANLLANVGPVTAQAIWYDDDAAGNTHYACNAPANSVAGKIALIVRGFGGAVCTATVPFTTKVKNAQTAGAVAVIVVNNAPGAPVVMGGGPDNTIIIPAVMISDVDGALIAAQLANNVNITLSGSAAGTVQLDGDLDNGIIAHEYFHGVSNRLTGGPANVGCLSNQEQAGEGWSDYMALMINTNWATATINDGNTINRPIGNYAFGYPTTGPGIRTHPYSTNLTVNPLTYTNLPTSVVPHGVGTVFCTALWEMTWAIIQTDGINPNFFNSAGTGGNIVAFRLMMEGLKLQPCSPGFIDARNAILQADRNLYNGVHACAIWTAFAKRGMGFSALQGSSASITDQTPAFDLPPSPVITTQPANAAACVGDNVTFAVNATGSNLTYQWQLSTTGAGGPWTNIANGGVYSGATTATLTITGVTVGLNNNQYRVVIYGSCPAVNSNPAVLTVGTGTPAITTHPVNTAVCAGGNTTFSVVASGSNLTYQWQLSTAGAGGPWTNISNGGVYSGVTTTTLTITGALIGMDNYQYRVNVTGGCAASTVSSNPAVLTVTTGGTTITLQPVNSAVCAGSNTSFTVAGTPAGLTYQWQLSTAGAGGPWNNISNGGVYSGATTATLTLTGVTVGMNNYQYRCILTGGCPPPVTSNPAVLTVDAGPAITSHPANTTVCVTTNATFSVTATGTTLTYQWQESTTGAGGPWNNITNGGVYSGAQTNTLTLTGVTAGMNNYQYRCVVSGSCPPPATSNPAVLTVVTLSTGGTITPANTVYCTAINNGTLTLSGHVGNIIRWESATNMAGPWTNITNTTNTLTYNNLAVTTYFRAFIQATGCAGAYSSIATVQVTALSAMTIVADPGTTICAGDPTRLTVMETSVGAPPVPVSITHSSSNAITSGNSVSCGTAITTAVNSFWRVYNLAAFPAVTGAYTINTVTFGVESSTGGPQNVTVRLYTQTGAAFPGGTRTQIATQTYSVPNLALALYTATLTTPVTVPNNSVIVVEVATAGAVGTRFFIGSNAAAETGPSYLSSATCAINTPTTTAAIGFPNMHIVLGLGGTVPGMTPVTGGTFLWSPAAGLSSTTTNPVAASPNTTTTYTVTHNNGGGCIRTASITINVNQRPVVTTHPASRTNCAGSSATFTVAGTGTALTYQWQVSTAGAGGPWVNLTNTAPYSNVTTAVLTVNPVTTAMSGYAYRCVLSGTCPAVGSANISNAAVLTVSALPTVSITPAGPVCGGIAGTNGIQLTASGATSYTWLPLAGLFTNAAATIPYTGGNSATVYAAPAVNTVYTVTGSSSTTTCSNTASVTINYTPDAPIVNPAAATICLGSIQPLTITSSLAPTTVTFTNNTPLNIPDGPATWPQTVFPGVTSTLPVAGIPGAAVISGISVKLNVTHTYIGDLVIVLKAPNGQVLNLDAVITRTGPAGADFVNTIISSAATAALSTGTAPYTGTFAPDAVGATFVAAGFTFPGGPTSPAGYIPTVSTFNALSSVPNGNWSLGIYDWGAGDIGTVTSWSMDITYGLPAAGIWSLNSAGSGNYTGLFSDAAATVAYTGTPVQTVYAKPATVGLFNYYATVSTGTCTSAGRLVPITVNQAAAITNITPNVTLCTDKVATFTVTATGTAPAYQWQVSTDGGTTWTNITNGGVYSGATTATLTITAPPVSMSGYQYRAIVQGALPCGGATSAARTLTVNPLPVVVITASPSTRIVPGMTTTISSNVTNGPATLYTWLRNGVIVPNANNASITVGIDQLGDYQLRVTNGNGCSNVSNIITITDSASGRCFIYPNPSKGMFEVRYYSMASNTNLPRTLTVYDAQGNRVLTQTFSIGRPYDRMPVDLRANGKGIYWVEVGDVNGNRLTVCRVIIQ